MIEANPTPYLQEAPSTCCFLRSLSPEMVFSSSLTIYLLRVQEIQEREQIWTKDSIYTKLDFSSLVRRARARPEKSHLSGFHLDQTQQTVIGKICILANRPWPWPTNSKSQTIVGRPSRISLLESISFCSLLPRQRLSGKLASCSPVCIGRPCQNFLHFLALFLLLGLCLFLWFLAAFPTQYHTYHVSKANWNIIDIWWQT